ncbi:MAG: hypothetical protein H0X14_03370 [Acidobacteria bacterium]|nr:hypothetical protein [Acidobacteriota bacterium]
MIQRRVWIAGIACRRLRRVDGSGASGRKAAVLMHNLRRCTMKNNGEQEKSQNARRRRMATKF